MPTAKMRRREARQAAAVSLTSACGRLSSLPFGIGDATTLACLFSPAVVSAPAFAVRRRIDYNHRRIMLGRSDSRKSNFRSIAIV
eukprot:4919566-Pleurochrysis_carterae.AAC.1